MCEGTIKCPRAACPMKLCKLAWQPSGLAHQVLVVLVIGMLVRILDITLVSLSKILYYGCVRLASLGRPGLPRYVRIALTGLTRVSPQCPACGVGHLGVTRGAWRYHERASVIVRLALVRGSPEWAPRGRPRELIERTHWPLLNKRVSTKNNWYTWYLVNLVYNEQWRAVGIKKYMWETAPSEVT